MKKLFGSYGVLGLVFVMVWLLLFTNDAKAFGRRCGSGGCAAAGGDCGSPRRTGPIRQFFVNLRERRHPTQDAGESQGTCGQVATCGGCGTSCPAPTGTCQVGGQCGQGTCLTHPAAGPVAPAQNCPNGVCPLQPQMPHLPRR